MMKYPIADPSSSPSPVLNPCHAVEQEVEDFAAVSKSRKQTDTLRGGPEINAQAEQQQLGTSQSIIRHLS